MADYSVDARCPLWPKVTRRWPDRTFKQPTKRSKYATLKLQTYHKGEIVLGQRIDQFCERLRLKLTNVNSNMEGLKAKIDGKAQSAEQDVRTHLDNVKTRIEQGRAKVSAAQADMKNWLEERKAVTSDKIAEWKAKREIGKLQSRADNAERYAAAAIDVAVATVDEAEQASLEAWLARQDADYAQNKLAAVG